MTPDQLQKVLSIYEEVTGVSPADLLRFTEDHEKRFVIRQAAKLNPAHWIVFYYEPINNEGIMRLHRWKVER